MRMTAWCFGSYVGLLAMALGCASEDAEGSRSDALTRGDASSVEALSWTEIYERVLVPNDCIGCHGKAAALDLSLEHGYENVLGVVAKGEKCAPTGMQRVDPGHPETSILLDKLTDAPICGAPMPIGPGAGKVSAEHIELVRAWIAQGAQP